MRIIRAIRVFFAWRNVFNTGVWLYQQNKITGQRRAFKVGEGHQPVSQEWLDRGHKP